jgi:hypothetical protein
MCSTINRKLKNRTRKDTTIKFCKAVAAPDGSGN